jgi:transcriptional regulator with PAS, ATPase and Fis domain
MASLEREIALWTSPRMRDLRDVVGRAALIDIPVLITGEAGTGKDLVARSIHGLGPRRWGPFVRINCAAVAHMVLDGKLFGRRDKGRAGSPAVRTGAFEAAHRGTIVLQAVGDLHPTLQAKLLQFLEVGRRGRGGPAVTPDVRVVATAGQNLETAVAAGRFREDLFYRLSVLRIVVPPLRQRLEEVPALAQYFAERYARLFQREHFVLPSEALPQLMRRRFPGNVRELETAIKGLVAEDGSRADIVPPVAAAARETDADRARPRPRLLKVGDRARLAKIKEAGLDSREEPPILDEGDVGNGGHG